MSANTSDYSLSTLLVSTPYTLAYALPLLFVSLILTFSGTFLTLDRTRAFTPRNDASKSSSVMQSRTRRTEGTMRRLFFLQGGAGGLASGYAFGVHFVTFLSLLIPSVSTSAPLSPHAFLAVWVLSAVCCSYIAGRWRYAALFLSGVSGYSTLALATCVIVHPTLLTRIVLTAIFLPIGTLLCLLPIPRYQHTFVRISTSAAGAFGIIISIASFAHILAWSNVWERLWNSNGADWNSGPGKGLSAAYCLLFLSGTACDWFLKRQFGENPDERWDNYLAEYASNLPNAADRAGTFTPFTSFWARHFGHRNTAPIPIFPTDADLKRPLPSPVVLQKAHSMASQSRISTPASRKGPDCLHKRRKRFVPGAKRMREEVKFSPLNVDDLSSSDEDEDLKSTQSLSNEKARTRRPLPTRSDSMATLVNETQPAKSIIGADGDVIDIEREKARPFQLRSKAEREVGRNMPDYSDYEEDVTAGATCPQVPRDSPEWSPAFLHRHFAHSAQPHTLSPPAKGLSSANSATYASSHMLTTSPLPYTPVPATPSLIRAIDRISAAQQAAYKPLSSPATPPLMASVRDGLPIHSGEPRCGLHGPKWELFWKDVKEKAGNGLGHGLA